MGSYVTAGRKAAGYPTTRAFARATHIHEKTLGKLEGGHPVGRDTLATVEEFLGWEPGSAHAVLAGGKPTLTVSRVQHTKLLAMTKTQLNDIAELIEEVLDAEIAERWLRGALDIRARTASPKPPTSESREREAG